MSILFPFGYSPLVAESFTDPEAYAGTCYKASGWEAVGMSQGNSRHRPDFYVPNQRPKRLWLKELCPKARQRLCALSLTQADEPAAVAIQNGVLPLNPFQVLSLFELLRHAPDPRAKNTQFRIDAVLTLVAMAILAGARDIAQIARFATRLHPKQRAALGLPRKVGSRCFYRVPGYNVFYQVLIRLDADQFARRLSEWLQAQSGMLPSAFALDGKMIRDCIGTVTLAEHEDGSPVALAIMDQKEGTRRCEQSAAASLLESLPALDGKVVSADALHCQKLTARTIVEKGGDYLLQIKAKAAEATVEVAHEALFTCWDRLKNWIAAAKHVNSAKNKAFPTTRKLARTWQSAKLSKMPGDACPCGNFTLLEQNQIPNRQCLSTLKSMKSEVLRIWSIRPRRLRIQ